MGLLGVPRMQVFALSYPRFGEPMSIIASSPRWIPFSVSSPTNGPESPESPRF
jgi:hypothetical protein